MARKRKCKTCRQWFYPHPPEAVVCSPECALTHSRASQEVEYKRATTARREALRTKSDWAKLAQKEFNAFIRIRDQDKPCISCGRFHNGQWHAGHYRTTAAAPELRFNELNCHRQCQPCNLHLSGAITEYRIELTRRIGESLVKWLEGPHSTPKKWTVEELKALRAYYRDAQKAMMRTAGESEPF